MKRFAPVRPRKPVTERVYCVACKGHKSEMGPLSRRGMCDTCALVHKVAQWLGMTHVYYYDESISRGVRLSYTGPVKKTA